MKTFFLTVLCLFLGLSAGFFIHNYSSFRDLSAASAPEVKILSREKMEVPKLSFKIAEESPRRLKPFPYPGGVSGDEMYYDAATDTLYASSETRRAREVNPSASSDGLEYLVTQAVRESNASYDSDLGNSESDYAIYDLPKEMQKRIPHFSYSSHVYSSSDSDRFITLNGRKFFEGDVAVGSVRVVKITPSYTVFRLDNTTFSVPSLTDWNGDE